MHAFEVIWHVLGLQSGDSVFAAEETRTKRVLYRTVALPVAVIRTWMLPTD